MLLNPANNYIPNSVFSLTYNCDNYMLFSIMKHWTTVKKKWKGNAVLSISYKLKALAADLFLLLVQHEISHGL